MINKVNLSQKLDSFSDHWSPKIVGQLNGQHVRLVKFQGEFVWHHHEHEDELFLGLHGSFRLDYRDEDGKEYSVEVGPGEFVIVPAGIEHRPAADGEVAVLLFEPAGTVNTGNAEDSRRVHKLQRI